MTKGLKAIHEEINSAKMENVDKDEFQDAYHLRFIGKNYAKFIADLPTETLIVPNTEWNNLPENKNSQNVLRAGGQGFESLPVHHFFRHLAEDAFFVG